MGRTDFERTRVTLALDGAIYPLLALSVSSDGGLMIDLAGCAPVEHFRYGVLDVPPGGDAAQAPKAPLPPERLHQPECH
jgi:hypothetical protein